jgi:pimeloyl-ACP methyl ester carboxylesterase/DNA-binding CsgD family transcriptional regulator
MELPATRYATSTGGVKIAYQVVGRGPDIVMVPGLTSHLELMWRVSGYRRFVLSLSRVGRVVRFDKRGTGLSDPVRQPPSLDERVDDLRAVVHAARCRRPFVFGYSEGGPIAIAYAAAFARSVRGLILYGAAAESPPPWAMQMMRSMATHWGEGRSLDIFGPSAADDEFQRAEQAMIERSSASPAMIRALVESLTAIDVTDRLDAVRAPTIVLHRRHEHIPIEYGRRMAAGIPGARLVELEGSDHVPWIDPDQVTAPIAEFVAAVGGRTPESESAPATHRAPRPRTGWSSLTPGELRVVRLAARGLKNAEIAERLYLSRHTVETHLKHAFAKLGVVSRGELSVLTDRNT